MPHRYPHLQPLNPGDPAPGCHFRLVPGWGRGMFPNPYVAVRPSRPRKKKAPKVRKNVLDALGITPDEIEAMMTMLDNVE